MKIDQTQFQKENSIQTEPAPEKPKAGKPDPRKDPKDWLVANLPKVKIACVVLLILAFVIGIRAIGTYRNLSADVKQQKQRIEDLQKAQGDGTEAPAGEESDGDGKTEEADRSTTDSERAGIFLEKLLTWTDYASYNEVRTAMADTYKLPADGNVLSTFLPEQSEEAFTNSGVSGMEFDSADSYVVRTDGEKISYFTVCSITVTSTEGNDKTAPRVCVFYTLDDAGNFTDVSAYTMSNQ